MSGWFDIGSAVIGGGLSLFGGRQQQSAANAQAAAQMQFERENMFHQNQVAWDMTRQAQDYNAAEAAKSRDWQSAQADISRRFNSVEADIARRSNSVEADIARRWNAQQALESRDWNAQQSGIERTFNAEEAAKNRSFQEYMSNTQYQRAIVDMQRAGINPMLAVSQGGAGNVSGSAASTSAARSSPASSGAASSGAASSSSPSGATASSSGGSPSGLARGAMAQQFNYIASAVASAAQVGQMVAGVRQLDAQTDKTKADTALVQEAIFKDKYAREGGHTAANIRNTQEKLGHETATAASRRDEASTDAAIRRIEERLTRSKEPGARAEAEFQQLMLEMLKGGSSSASGMGSVLKMILPLLMKGLGK